MSAPAIDRFATGRPNPTAKPRAEKDEKTPSSDADGSKTPRKSPLKNKKVLIALVALLVAGGVGYKMFMPTKPGPPQAGDVVSIDPNTLNLSGGHYLKIAISIQLVKGKASATDFYTSKAAELTIDEFSDRSVTSLSTNAERKKLSAQLTKKIQAAYPGEVYDVYVTQFVTQ